MKDSLGLRLAQERRDFFTELKKGKTKVADVVLIQIFVMLIYIYLPMILVIRFINSERLEVFLKDIIPWKTFPVFLRFWSWLIDRISLSERLVFFILKDTSNWFRKTCFFFLFWKTFYFIRKTWMLQKDMYFLQKDMNSYFQKDWLLKDFFTFIRKTFNFLQKDLCFFQKDCCNILQKDLWIFQKDCCNILQKDLFIFQKDL